jgi:YbbR domain-containing protein
VLGGINSVDVDVNLRNRKSDFSVFGLPLSYNATGGLRSNVAFQPYEVKITVGIEKGEALKTVGVTPVFVNELPEGILIKNIVFDPPVISLQGGQALLDTIETVKSTPINLSNRFNDFTDQVAVDVPKGLEMRGKNLISIKVNLMTIKDTKTLILVPKFINLAEGLAVSGIDPSAVKVNLTGKADALNKLKADDVVLEVDLRGLVSGVQEITLANANFKIKDDVVAVSSFDPQALKLQIVKQSN